MNASTLSIPPSHSADRFKGRVLCVDDEPNILRALSWLLRKDFQVVTADSAEDALGLVSGGEFDVVISDHRMPEMSGVDFLSQVKVLAPRAMRILLTGYSDMQAVIQSVNESEVFRFVSKPWDVVELPLIVAQAAAIARRQELAPPPPKATHPEVTGQRLPKILVLDEDEATHSVTEMSAGDLAQIVHVTSPVDAFKMLEDEEIGIILSERTLGTMDLTHLLCLLKRKHPQIVSLVITDSEDSNLICRMINEGQIHRFIPKPLKAGNLRLALKSAIAKRNELLNAPQLAERHQVAVPACEESCARHAAEAASVATGRSPSGHTEGCASASAASSALGRLFRRLLWS
ncbi:response regulator [Dechloromonas sp. XY25]|uniref:Response regulator n=1 Tax=Dechloromonas hankyongensis TaxID=2908002 RepID=A0ABS9K1U2_9RHOO|nr:response regulator [Dechloromonas hankyongensis]MCG2577152.1 response regulator [Dechloromonas hankyongensis]